MRARPGRPDLVIVGGGMAGLATATEAARQGLSTIVLDDGPWGGLVVNVGVLDRVPSVGPVAGASLAAALMEEGRELGVDYRPLRAEALLEGGGRTGVRAGGERFPARHVVLATGARIARLGVPGEAELEGRGVSRCAWCDGALFRGERVVVVGGGDSACQEALHLLALGCEVVLVTRGPRLRCQAVYRDALAASAGVSFRWRSTVSSILGERRVQGVRVRHLESGEESVLEAPGVFIFPGLVRESGWLPEDLARGADGALVVDERLATTRAGVHAVGAARAGYSGALLEAMADGVRVVEALTGSGEG